MSGSRRVRAAKIVEWAVLAAIPVLTAARFQYPAPVTPADLGDFLVKWLHARYAAIVLILALLGLSAKLAQELLGAEFKSRLKAVLDTLDEACFRDVPREQRYENRVTLFKTKGRGTKLKGYCRSGTVYQRGIRPLAVDEGQEGANDGIGGQAWFRNATVSVDSLPDCPVPCSASDPRCQDYAKRGYMTVDKVSRLHVRSRSLVGTPIRGEGKKWGVLVVDTRRPEAFTDMQRGLIESFALAIGKMV